MVDSTVVRYRAPRQIQSGRSQGSLRRPRSGARRRRALTAWGLLAPAIVIIAAFVFWPAIRAFWLSLTNSSGLNRGNFVGLSNYARVFTSSDALRAIWNTIAYALLYIPAVIVVALAVALLLNRKDLPLRGFFRTAIFLPFVISMAVAALVWNFLIDPNLGLIPYWLSKIGIHMGDVLSNSTWALPAVAAVAVWKNFGYFMVIFLAGLQAVSRDLYEAAQIDGAGSWRRFWSVTLPGLSGTMTYVLVFALIGAFQAFDQIYIMTNGGPDHATETIVYRIYVEGFRNFRLGYASAVSYVLLAMTLIVGLVQLRRDARREKEVM